MKLKDWILSRMDGLDDFDCVMGWNRGRTANLVNGIINPYGVLGREIEKYTRGEVKRNEISNELFYVIKRDDKIAHVERRVEGVYFLIKPGDMVEIFSPGQGKIGDM